MRLYPLENEVRSTVNEEDNLAEEFIASEVLQGLCDKIVQDDTEAKRSRRANLDKSLHQFASRKMTQSPDSVPYLKDHLYSIKTGEVLDSGEFATFKQQVKTLYRDTLKDFSGIIATTAVGATPMIVREELQPDLIIVDEAATMDETSLLILIAHYSPKAWVITGDIAQKPPHLTMEHDLGPGQITSNPFAAQKQTSLLHRVVEGNAKHSTLSMNMRAHGSDAFVVNDLFYNGENVNKYHPRNQCIAQLEFTRARATPRSSSQVNLTHAGWIMEHIESILKSDLKGVGKNAGKPMTVLVVAAYKEQV
ncbi:hypothetical protein ACLX1H_007650 [Fusarium chlamydosporum]